MMDIERIELIRIEDVFQITGRGSVLAGCFKGSPEDKRMGMIIGAKMMTKDILGNEIEMKALGLDIMRNHYIDWASAKEFNIGILVDKHITLELVPRFSPLFIISDKKRTDSVDD